MGKRSRCISTTPSSSTSSSQWSCYALVLLLLASSTTSILVVLDTASSVVLVHAATTDLSSSNTARRRPSVRWFPRPWGSDERNSRRNGVSQNTTAANTTSTRTTPVPNSTTAMPPAALPLWKKSLPERLQRRSTLERIIIPTSPSTHVQIYLLGTSHVSNDSSADVTLLLQSVKPDVVFVELCEQRINLLTPPPTLPVVESNNKTMSVWKRAKEVQQHSNMSRLSALSTVLLTSVQDQYADSLGVELGSEFRVAYDYCVQKSPILVLGDRPLQVTLLRAWEGLSWWEKIKVFVALLWSSLQKPNPEELREWMRGILESEHNGTDLLTESIHELRRHVPSLERTIIKERDCYMACKLYQMAGMLPRQRNITCVAIVGAGHCAGMIEWMTNSTKAGGKSPSELLWEVVKTNKFRGEDVASLTTHVIELPMTVVSEDEEEGRVVY